MDTPCNNRAKMPTNLSSKRATNGSSDTADSSSTANSTATPKDDSSYLADAQPAPRRCLAASHPKLDYSSLLEHLCQQLGTASNSHSLFCQLLGQLQACGVHRAMLFAVPQAAPSATAARSITLLSSLCHDVYQQHNKLIEPQDLPILQHWLEPAQPSLYYSPKLRDDPQIDAHSLATLQRGDYQALLALPLCSTGEHGEVFALLLLGWPEPQHFSNKAQRFYQSLAGLSALAWQTLWSSTTQQLLPAPYDDLSSLTAPKLLHTTPRTQLYEAILDNLPEGGVLVFDKHLRYTLVRGDEWRNLGVKPQEIEGRSFRVLLPEQDWQTHEAFHRLALEGMASETELSHLGQRYKLYYLPIPSPSLDSSIGMLVFRNISLQYQLEEEWQHSEALLRDAQEAADLAIWSYDLRSDHIHWSRRMFDFHALPYSFVPKFDNTMALYSDHSREQLQQRIQEALQQGRSYHIELEIVGAKGSRRWVRSFCQPKLEHGKVVALNGAFQDISEQKRTSQALEQAKEEAEADNRAKSHFLANMSHELRTPLNAILGFAQLIGRDSSLSAEQQEHISIIQRSGQHLLELINDVLEMSKIEAGRDSLQTDSFELPVLLQDITRMMALRASKKNIYLKTEASPDLPYVVYGDARKLRQVLLNLLSNAIKFTDKGGVTLRVKHRPLAADALSIDIEVEDSGYGIAPHEQAQLFEAFSQSESGRQQAEGTGLGLAISRRFVQLMGGDIQVSSQRGQGSLFAFSIRVRSSSVPTAASSHQPARVLSLATGQPSYRILIAEDRYENRLLLRHLLSPIGFEVQQARNGHEAIEKWQQWHPHCIFMDLRMPGLDGYQATKHIKASIEGQATPIIALTASTFAEERQQVLDAGFDDFIRKPFVEEEIFSSLTRHIGARYHYEQEKAACLPATESIPATLSPETLQAATAHLPADWFSSLRNAVICADAEMMHTLIARLEPLPIAQSLHTLVEDFAYEKLLTLLPDGLKAI